MMLWPVTWYFGANSFDHFRLVSALEHARFRQVLLYIANSTIACMSVFILLADKMTDTTHIPKKEVKYAEIEMWPVCDSFASRWDLPSPLSWRRTFSYDLIRQRNHYLPFAFNVVEQTYTSNQQRSKATAIMIWGYKLYYCLLILILIIEFEKIIIKACTPYALGLWIWTLDSFFFTRWVERLDYDFE